MKYWVISPNVFNTGDELVDEILEFIEKEHIVLMGFDSSHNVGKRFIELIKEGDLVIVARGSNKNKTSYFAGIVATDKAIENYRYKTNVEKHQEKQLLAIARELKDFISLKNDKQLPWSTDCVGGKSKNPGTLCELKLNEPSDKKVIDEVLYRITQAKGEQMRINIKDLLESNKNVILTGAPGTGKTYLAKQVAMKMTANSDNSSDRIGFVQFHPSYDYTDFVEGLRPSKESSKVSIGFERKDGIFKEFCKKALKQSEEKFVFIIDEINRGEISKIFGELFYAIDPSYRGTEGKVQTQYQSLIATNDAFINGFFVPENVYIIGTMNDIDKSVESMDFAVRRRFAWIEVNASETQDAILSSLDKNIKDKTITRMNYLNNAIETQEEFSKDYHIGAAYFLKLKLYYRGENDMSEAIESEKKAFESLWENHIKLLLVEYTRGFSNQEAIMEKFKNAYNGTESK